VAAAVSGPIGLVEASAARGVVIVTAGRPEIVIEREAERSAALSLTLR